MISIQIENPELFGQICRNAEIRTRENLGDTPNAKRWIVAINRAFKEVFDNGEFMHFDHDTKHLIIWSQGSSHVYTVTPKACTCRAAVEFRHPCWHRASQRLLQEYFEEGKPIGRAA